MVLVLCGRDFRRTDTCAYPASARLLAARSVASTDLRSVGKRGVCSCHRSRVPRLVQGESEQSLRSALASGGKEALCFSEPRLARSRSVTTAPMPSGHAEAMELGREALRRGEWVEACRRFEQALVDEEAADAYEGLGVAARYALDAAATFDAQERGYQLARARRDDVTAARGSPFSSATTPIPSVARRRRRAGWSGPRCLWMAARRAGPRRRSP